MDIRKRGEISSSLPPTENGAAPVRRQYLAVLQFGVITGVGPRKKLRLDYTTPMSITAQDESSPAIEAFWRINVAFDDHPTSHHPALFLCVEVPENPLPKVRLPVALRVLAVCRIQFGAIAPPRC
jgi:hypothetical protein|tara:strand:- start:1085 stop:1459 length:375 start_codon:yes stop_codon:yes gene_type:complete